MNKPNWRGEFDWIRYVQARCAAADSSSGVELGIGDDCALLQAPSEELLAVSTDTLVAGVHFFEGVSPTSLGHKALAVNLSDLAAMGARPLWFTLNLTLPKLDQVFVESMLDSMLHLAQHHRCMLVGGDTTRGPLSITISVFGSVPKQLALRRSGARSGDAIYVSGPLGAAAAAVELQKKGEPVDEHFARALDRPVPRIELGLALRGLASSALDISDGLSGDLRHLCSASELDAHLDVSSIPVLTQLRAQFGDARAADFALYGGDDYELCFSAPDARRDAIHAISQTLGLHITRIGTFETKADTEACVRLMHRDGRVTDARSGYVHFASNAS